MEATMTQTTIGEMIADWFYGAEGDDFAGMTVETYQAYSAIAEDVLTEASYVDEFALIQALSI
jgi:hypothetical protein